jgi:hypothetical protein
MTVYKSLLLLGLYSLILVSSGSEPLVDSILIDSDLVRFGTVTLSAADLSKSHAALTLVCRIDLARAGCFYLKTTALLTSITERNSLMPSHLVQPTVSAITMQTRL